MVKADPRSFWPLAGAWLTRAAPAVGRWLRSGGLPVLAGAAALMLALGWWPLRLGAAADGGGSHQTDPTRVSTDGDNRDWVHRSLRQPLGASDEPAAEMFDEDPVISEVVLVGLSYRRGGGSLGFFRIDGGGTEILAEDEASQGVTVLRLGKDHALVERDGEQIELRRVLDAETTGGAS